MKRQLLLTVLGFVCLLVGTVRADDARKATEEALLKRAESFAEAFNQGDAKLLASFFTADADIVDPEGRPLSGRKAIEESYGKYFARSKGTRLMIRIQSVRIARPDLAFEDGVTEVVSPNGGPPSSARYSVVYVKQDGNWYLTSVREAIAVPPNNTERLGDLGFLIGNWQEDVEKGGSAQASYSWDVGQNFIHHTFDLVVKDVSLAHGIQWIGYDASIKKPRAWTFLFNGGFAESVWTADGDKGWKISINGTQRDGTKITATNIFTRVDDDHFTTQMTNITVGGKAIPDGKVTRLKRVR